jgi:glycosyltransferase involved in cell wall biosynthesis
MNSNENRNYILVSFVKDEEKNLPALINTVSEQNIIPTIWFIINDGSIDKSPEIIKNASKKYKWIRTLNLPISKRGLGLRLSAVCNTGFKYVTEYCKKNDIYYDYIGSLDADIILENIYYEKLMYNFEKYEKMGIASGSTWSFDGKSYFKVKDRPDEPNGASRLWRKACFEDSWGYILTHAPDTVSNIKARLHGWDTKVFFELKARQTRLTSSKAGLWKGFTIKGEADYFHYMRVSYIILRMLTYLSRPRFYLGFAYLKGYLSSFINRTTRIQDQEIIDYNKSVHLKKSILSIIRK